MVKESPKINLEGDRWNTDTVLSPRDESNMAKETAETSKKYEEMLKSGLLRQTPKYDKDGKITGIALEDPKTGKTVYFQDAKLKKTVEEYNKKFISPGQDN